MIRELAINNDGTFSHSGKNVTKFGSHFDGVFFYFFENDTEREIFLSEIIKNENNDNTDLDTIETIESSSKKIMQTHENTNIEKPVMIGKKTHYKSKKYRLNTLDYLKGFIVASLTSALFVVQQLADGGTLSALNYKPILMAAISGGVGYLIKNFFTDSKNNEKHS